METEFELEELFIGLDEEFWESIKGYEGLYEISNLGRVKSLAKFANRCDGKEQWRVENIISTQTNKYGYCWVSIRKNGKNFTHDVHRLVAEKFVDNPNTNDKNIILHLNGNKTENFPYNLGWFNTKEAVAYSLRLNCSRFKLSEEDILNIMVDERKNTEIGKAYNIHANTIGGIKNGRIWDILK